MKRLRFAYGKTGLLCLTTAILANPLAAGTPGTCTQTCSSMCGFPSSPSSAGVPCMIRVSEDASTNTATATMLNPRSGNAKANQDICVDSGTEILWLTDEENSQLVATFGKQHPFSHRQGKAAIFKAKNGQPVSDIAKGKPNSITACYQYNVSHKVSGHSKKTADPKVIVNGGTGD
jgi:hypothetical protein